MYALTWTPVLTEPGRRGEYIGTVQTHAIGGLIADHKIFLDMAQGKG